MVGAGSGGCPAGVAGWLAVFFGKRGQVAWMAGGSPEGVWCGQDGACPSCFGWSGGVCCRLQGVFEGVDVVFHDEFAQRTGFFGGVFVPVQDAAGDGTADGEQFACGVAAVGFRQVRVLHGRSFGCPVREKRP